MFYIEANDQTIPLLKMHISHALNEGTTCHLNIEGRFIETLLIGQPFSLIMPHDHQQLILKRLSVSSAGELQLEGIDALQLLKNTHLRQVFYHQTREAIAKHLISDLSEIIHLNWSDKNAAALDFSFQSEQQSSWDYFHHHRQQVKRNIWIAKNQYHTAPAEFKKKNTTPLPEFKIQHLVPDKVLVIETQGTPPWLLHQWKDTLPYIQAGIISKISVSTTRKADTYHTQTQTCFTAGYTEEVIQIQTPPTLMLHDSLPHKDKEATAMLCARWGCPSIGNNQTASFPLLSPHPRWQAYPQRQQRNVMSLLNTGEAIVLGHLDTVTNQSSQEQYQWRSRFGLTIQWSSSETPTAVISHPAGANITFNDHVYLTSTDTLGFSFQSLWQWRSQVSETWHSETLVWQSEHLQIQASIFREILAQLCHQYEDSKYESQTIRWNIWKRFQSAAKQTHWQGKSSDWWLQTGRWESKTISIQAKQSITIQVGSSGIHLSPSIIQLSGQQLQLSAKTPMLLPIKPVIKPYLTPKHTLIQTLQVTQKEEREKEEEEQDEAGKLKDYYSEQL